MSSIGPRNRSPSPDSRQAPSPSTSQGSKQDTRQKDSGSKQRKPDHKALKAQIDTQTERLELRHEAQQAEISVSTRVTRQAGNPDSYPILKEGSVALSDQNLTIMGTSDHGQGGLSTDRTGFMAKGNTGTGDDAVSGMGGIVTGNTYGELAVKLSPNDTLAVGMLNGPGVHGTGLTATQHLGTHALNEGVFVVGDAAQTVAVNKSRPDDNKVLVTFSDKKWVGMQATFGASGGPVGGGLRAYMTHNRDYQLQRWMPREDASAALKEQPLWKQKLRSLGLMPQPFVRPDLMDPRGSLQLDDKISFTKQTNLTGGVAAALGGIYVGLHASVAVEQHTVVEKRAENSVRVTVNPKPSKSMVGGISVDVPLLAAASVTLSRSVGRTFTFDFDLDVPDAVNAYHDVLKGKMPSSILMLDPSMIVGSTDSLMRLNHEENLPAGVSVVALVYGARMKDLTLTAGLTALPNILGDKVGMMGYKMRAGQTNYIAASDNAVLVRNEAAREGAWGYVRRGSSSISAKLVESTEQSFQGNEVLSSTSVTLEASFLRDRPSGSTREDMLAWLNNNFFERKRNLFEKLKPMGDKYSYGLKVTRALQDEDLKTLWHSGAIAGLAKPTSTEQHPLTDDQRETVVDAIKSNIVRNGVDEFSRLHRALGGDDNLEIKVENDALKTIETAHLNASVKYAAPIDAETPVKEVVKRIKTAEKHFKRLVVAERDFRDDLLAQTLDQASTQEAIEEARAQRKDVPAYAKIDKLSPEAAQALRAELPKKALLAYGKLQATKAKWPPKS